MSLIYKFTAKWLLDEYHKVTSELDLDDLQHLPEVIAITVFNFATKLKNYCFPLCNEKRKMLKT